METTKVWVGEELDTLDLGHRARENSGRRMMSGMVEHPAGTLAQTFADPAEREAAYRFVESPRFSWTQLAAAIHHACARRCARHDEVLVVLDGSSFRHTDNDHDDGVGPIGSRRNGARGLKVMAALAMTFAGVPLGVAAHHLWARSDEPAGDPARRPLADKESRFWTVLQRDFEQTLAEQEADCSVWYVMDSEADALHVLLRAMEGTRMTVRMHYDRNLAALVPDTPEHPELKTMALLEASEPRGHMWAWLPRRGHREPRLACLELRAERVGVRLREQWTKRWVGDVPLNVVWAREQGCPEGEEPIEWVLWTTEPIDTFEAVTRVVRVYALRFRIEGVFYASKTGLCETERSQLESFEALARWVTMKLSVAVRFKALLEASRSEPDVPADREFTRDEIDGALHLHQQWCRGKTPLGSTPTLAQMVTMVAQLGGYTGKSSGGPPGIKTFSRGMDYVEVAATVLRAQRERSPSPTEGDGFG